MFKKKKIKEEYLNLLNKYTSINTSNYKFHSKVEIETKFCDLFDCSTYFNRAIKFKDDMKSCEFQQVFEILIKDLGKPDLFGEYDGFVWKKKGYIITFGLIPLRYNYEVPMICVSRKTSIFFRYISYDQYTKIADQMYEAFFNRGVNIQTYYKIMYYHNAGYYTIVSLPNVMIHVSYKKNKLSVIIVPQIYHLDKTIIESSKRYKKEVFVDSSDLYTVLNALLEDTKEYHGLVQKL